MIISMTKKHIDLIKQGKKTTTLRSLTEVYPLGYNTLSDNVTEIAINSRTLTLVFERIFNFDKANYLDEKIVARTEGYKSWGEVVSELKKMRHKLPKKMWLYEFKVVK